MLALIRHKLSRSFDFMRESKINFSISKYFYSVVKSGSERQRRCGANEVTVIILAYELISNIVHVKS